MTRKNHESKVFVTDIDKLMNVLKAWVNSPEYEEVIKKQKERERRTMEKAATYWINT